MTPDPRYLDAVAKAAKKHGVPAELLAAQIQAESGWDPDVVSPAGAIGISQFMPGTAKGFGIDPHDPFQSIDAQARMMHNLLKKYGGDKSKALAAYNAGSGAVDKYNGVPPYKETQDYIKRILANEKNYPGLATRTTPVTPKTPKAIDDAPTDPLKALTPDAAPVVLPPVFLKGSRIPMPGTGSASQGQLPALRMSGSIPLPALPSIKMPSAADFADDPPVPAPDKAKAAAAGTKTVGATLVASARSQIGVPYKWGGATPGVAFDCSGLVQWAAAQHGIKVSHFTGDQVHAGIAVNLKNLQPGDLLFFGADHHHVAIYTGNGKMIEAPHAGANVREVPLRATGLTAARRLTGKK